VCVEVNLISTRGCVVLVWTVHMSIAVDTLLVHYSTQVCLGMDGESLQAMYFVYSRQ